MTRRLSLDWPDPRPFAGRDGRPIRILAASDDVDPTLEVRGQSRGARAGRPDPRGRRPVAVMAVLPRRCVPGAAGLRPRQPRSGRAVAVARRHPAACRRSRHPLAAWRPDPRSAVAVVPARRRATRWPRRLDAGRARGLREPRPRTVRRPRRSATRRLATPATRRRTLTTSASTPYRLVARRLRPPLWLHGHTNPAAQADWRVAYGPTTVVNVTGSVLVDLMPPLQPISGR